MIGQAPTGSHRRAPANTVGSRFSLQSGQTTPTLASPPQKRDPSVNSEGALLHKTGERLMAQLKGGAGEASKSQPASTGGVVEVIELTQLLKKGLKLVEGGVAASAQETPSANSRPAVPPVYHQFFREIVFEPPWQHRVGQLQGVVAALRIHSRPYLRAKCSIIVRCFPFGSARGNAQPPWVYMELVYRLLYAVSETQQGSLAEIQPLLLDYSTYDGWEAQLSAMDEKADSASSKPLNASTTDNATSAICRQIKWTPASLLRCRFPSEVQAQCFLHAFNNSASTVFDRQVMRVPFAHADQTWPERQLRQQLQAFCKERNRSGGRGRWDVRLFHNGLQVFKLVGNSKVGILSLDELPPHIRHSHSMVCTLRKYAQLYEEKRFNAIIQNLPLDNSFHHPPFQQNDAKLIDKLVARVFHSDDQRESPGGGSADSATSVGYKAHRLQRNTGVNGGSGGRPSPPLVRIQFESVREAANFIRRFGAVYRMEIDIGVKSGGPVRSQAYAHSDFTPPELALSYALNDYCRQRNFDGSRSGQYYTYSKVFEKRG